MVIKINGKDEMIEKKLNLAELVAAKKLSPEKIVIEYNLRIAPKDKWQNVILGESDHIEIVSFVGGG